MTEKNEKNKIRFPIYFYNWITYFGVFLSLLFFIIECTLFGLDFFYGGQNIYLGIITYVIFPTFLLLGLGLIPLGAILKRRKVLKGLAVVKPKPFHIDPSIPSHRNVILVFFTGTIILIVMSGIGAYKGFHYTESVHFCGVVCHNVMEPEYTTYLNSPHARVKCVDCHIGSGADWFVRSKFSGTRQIFAALGNTFSRPIPTPVENLRPSKETCEQCHWPEKFYPSVEVRHQYFLPGDVDDNKWLLRMLVHEGQSNSHRKGLHAHIYGYKDIFYVADETRQEITWVKSIDNDGNELIFTTPDSEYQDSEPPPEVLRKMDCMDCHNRPSHQFKSPRELLNLAMEKGDVDPKLPNIKQQAMEIMTKDFSSQSQAAEEISQALTTYYKENYIDLYADKKEAIEKAVQNIIELYRNNFFPAMNARWDVYPDNIGHLESPGCFRCHDDNHIASNGKSISKDCKLCHTIFEQGLPDQLEKSTDGLEFKHPVEIGEIWKEMNCSDCHKGS